MIYFDNAASSYFKPKPTVDKAIFTIKNLSVGAGRSNHFLSVEAERQIYLTRKRLSAAFSNGCVERCIFTPNCTAALNYAIFGLPLKKKRIITTVTEHNSVLRPLYELKRRGADLTVVGFGGKPFVTAKSVLNAVDDDVAFIVINAVSNVTGYMNEFEEVARSVGKTVPVVVDGAQLGGHKRVDMQKDNIACLALAGHKGLMALQGVGALLFTKAVTIEPTIFGGSGNETFSPRPSSYPELLEAGTHNVAAIASLGESLDKISDSIEEISDRLTEYTAYLIGGLEQLKGIKVYSSANPFGLCSFSIEGLSSTDAAEIYWRDYCIAVRGGYHCAPLLHEALGTKENGLIRASLSAYNTHYELDAFLKATEDIISSF